MFQKVNENLDKCLIINNDEDYQIIWAIDF